MFICYLQKLILHLQSENIKVNFQMREDNVAIRLKGFIDEMGLTNSQFADKCGIPRPSLSQLLTGRNKKISDVIVGQIHKAFPELSVLWLLFSEGPMLKKEEVKVASVPNGEILFDDIPEYEDNRSEKEKYSNLSALNREKISDNYQENSLLRRDLKITELEGQIEKMRKNPRKVLQITVYYDDSTFETFYPGK